MSLKTAGDLIAQAQQSISCVSVEKAQSLFEENRGSAIILDVRESESATKSKLTDSVNISRGLVEMQFPKICSDADTLVLTHCGGGGRASLVAASLQQMGYTNVHAITAPFDDIKSAFG